MDSFHSIINKEILVVTRNQEKKGLIEKAEKEIYKPYTTQLIKKNIRKKLLFSIEPKVTFKLKKLLIYYLNRSIIKKLSWIENRNEKFS